MTTETGRVGRMTVRRELRRASSDMVKTEQSFGAGVKTASDDEIVENSRSSMD
jgi:hypothetical protein